MRQYCDPDTLGRARAGDLEAAYALYVANQALIQRVARRFSHLDNAVALEDLMQEGFLAVVDAVQSYNAPAALTRPSAAGSTGLESEGFARAGRACAPRSSATAIDESQSWQRALTRELKRCFNRMFPARQRRGSQMVAVPGGTPPEGFRRSIRRAVTAHADSLAGAILAAHDIAGEPLGDVAERLGLPYPTVCARRRAALLRLRRNPELRDLYRDAHDIETLSYSRSAEECALLLLCTREDEHRR